MGVVDDLGRPLFWLSIPTIGERGPEDAARRIAAAVQEAIHKAGLEASDIVRVGLASPGGMDIPAGIITTPINLKGWENAPIRDLVAHHSHMPVTFENDGNAAAYGEFWVGAGRTYSSMVLLTLGTGIGTALFIDGRLVPNTELGHIELGGREAEDWAAANNRKLEGLKWKEWAVRVDAYLTTMNALLWPELIIVGGGVSKKHHKFLPRLTVDTEVVPAQLRNEAGIIGAALFAEATL